MPNWITPELIGQILIIILSLLLFAFAFVEVMDAIFLNRKTNWKLVIALSAIAAIGVISVSASVLLLRG